MLMLWLQFALFLIGWHREISLLQYLSITTQLSAQQGHNDQEGKYSTAAILKA